MLKIKDNVDLVGLSPLWVVVKVIIISLEETLLKAMPNNNSLIVTLTLTDVTEDLWILHSCS